MRTDAEQSSTAELDADEIRRYSRHLILSEVGVQGQLALKQARVLMIGAGGLGSPLGLYLAAAGIGTLGLVDFDVVDESNLQRQVLFGQADVGRPKIEAAVERLRDVNPHITLEPHELRLEASNALELLQNYDIVVDGSDNFATRYLVNDACVLLGKPNVYGSIFRFEGQVSVFWGQRGPCYRCLFSEPPPPHLVPSCAEGGVLGVLPGIIGSLQANEVIKLVLGQGDSMIGRLLLFDALKMQFRELRLRKDPECPVCSDNPTQRELIDYEEFCGVQQDQHPEAYPEDEFEITVETLDEWRQQGREFHLIDVRTEPEYAICHIQGGRLVPLQELQSRVGELADAEPMVVYCHHGMRSARATQFLRQQGLEKTWSLAGGIDAWAQRIDPRMPRY